MIRIAITFIILTLIGEILLFFMQDNLPVLEHLGCKGCLRVYVPVCGTDNKTYLNACKLNCKNMRRKKPNWVFIKRYGPCIDYSTQFKTLFSEG